MYKPHEFKFSDVLDQTRLEYIYMILGNGANNQFRSMKEVNKVVKDISKQIEKNSYLLYFGDPPNSYKPDVGLLYKKLSKLRPDIKIIMIQIDEMKKYGTPDFVQAVYWHKDYNKDCKWGGLDKNKQPCSNTKKWVNIHKRQTFGIKKVFVVGGGDITMNDIKLIKKHNVPYEYFCVERKYKGDGKTLITDKMSKKERVGVTYKHK